MREIKFRAWDGKEMHQIHRWSIYKDGTFNVWKRVGNRCVCIVIKNEIMQFTGLLDKNGKEIYEGDVVEVGIRHYKIGDLKPEIVSEVYFEYGCFLVWGESASEHDLCKFTEGAYHVEIIGNIYENPELLK